MQLRLLFLFLVRLLFSLLPVLNFYKYSFRRDLFIFFRFYFLSFWRFFRREYRGFAFGSAKEFQAKNFTLLTGFLEKNNIDYRYIPIGTESEFATRVAIDSNDAAKLFNLLHTESIEGFLCCFLGQGLSFHFQVCDAPFVELQERYDFNGWRFFVCGENEFYNKVSCRCACEVEFYKVVEQQIFLNSQNDITKIIMTSEPIVFHQIFSKKVPSWRVMVDNQSLLSRDFDVDIVYTWVDGSDSRWLEEKNRYEGMIAAHPDATNRGRFTSRDELKYSLRSVAFNTNFVRNIYVVTNGQVPEWLDLSNPRLRIIRHEEIFRRPELSLPTFNSHAIESNIHRIDGLADRYIYLNDDCFFSGSVERSDFYSICGRPFAFINHSNNPGFVAPHALISPFINAGRNTVRVIYKKFGVVVNGMIKHSPYVQCKKTLIDIDKEIGDELLLTEMAKFRSELDISLPASLSQFWGLVSGDYELGSMETMTISLTDKIDMSMALLLLPKLKSKKFVCINESISLQPNIQKRVDREVVCLLNHMLPAKSEFEK